MIKFEQEKPDMKKKIFAAALVVSIISAAGFATAQNLVDPVSNDTDLSNYAEFMSRNVADGFYSTDVIRTVVYREPVLAKTSLDFQSQYGLPSINTRQLDYQHRRSGWRLATGLPQAVPEPKQPVLASGEILALSWFPTAFPQALLRSSGRP